MLLVVQFACSLNPVFEMHLHSHLKETMHVQNNIYIKSTADTSSRLSTSVNYFDLAQYIMDILPFRQDHKAYIINQLANPDISQNIIGFIQITNYQNTIQIGRFTSGFDRLNSWYNSYNANNISLSTLLYPNNIKYGTLVDAGIYNVSSLIPVQFPQSFYMDTSINIYIGFKNNVAI